MKVKRNELPETGEVKKGGSGKEGVKERRVGRVPKGKR